MVVHVHGNRYNLFFEYVDILRPSFDEFKAHSAVGRLAELGVEQAGRNHHRLDMIIALVRIKSERFTS